MKGFLHSTFGAICLVPLGLVVFIVATGIIGGIIYGPLILVIKLGQQAHRQSACQDRTYDGLQAGFLGNSDFYGLGIRLGLYLQWLSSLLANILLPQQRRMLAGTYWGFTIALYVATLIIICQQGCAFTAEIVILLYVFWGGIFTVTLPFLAASYYQAGLHGTQQISGLVVMPFAMVTTWFWTRIATKGETDFVATPGPGTTIFMFACIRGTQLRIAGILMMTLAIFCWAATPILLLSASLAQYIRGNTSRVGSVRH